MPLCLLARTDLGDVILWVTLLAALLIVGAVGLTVARRRLLGGNGEERQGLTLADLRRLHAQGAMTSEEFEAARAALVGSARPAQPHAHVRELRERRAAPDPGTGGEAGPPAQ